MLKVLSASFPIHWSSAFLDTIYDCNTKTIYMLKEIVQAQEIAENQLSELLVVNPDGQLDVNTNVVNERGLSIWEIIKELFN